MTLPPNIKVVCWRANPKHSNLLTGIVYLPLFNEIKTFFFKQNEKLNFYHDKSNTVCNYYVCDEKNKEYY